MLSLRVLLLCERQQFSIGQKLDGLLWGEIFVSLNASQLSAAPIYSCVFQCWSLLLLLKRCVPTQGRQVRNETSAKDKGQKEVLQVLVMERIACIWHAAVENGIYGDTCRHLHSLSAVILLKEGGQGFLTLSPCKHNAAFCSQFYPLVT